MNSKSYLRLFILLECLVRMEGVSMDEFQELPETVYTTGVSGEMLDTVVCIAG
jgi:hypothetical protein